MDWNLLQEEFELEVEGCFEWLANEYTKISSGRVNPSLFTNIGVEAYGSMMKMNEVANVQVVDSRQLLIKPYDSSLIKDIALAINSRNMNANVQVNADNVRITFAALTEDSRKVNVKKAKEAFENAKIKIRNVRQDIQAKYKKDATISDDDKKYYEEQLNKITKDANSKLETIFSKKENELLSL